MSLKQLTSSNRRQTISNFKNTFSFYDESKVLESCFFFFCFNFMIIVAATAGITLSELLVSTELSVYLLELSQLPPDNNSIW